MTAEEHRSRSSPRGITEFLPYFSAGNQAIQGLGLGLIIKDFGWSPLCILLAIWIGFRIGSFAACLLEGSGLARAFGIFVSVVFIGLPLAWTMIAMWFVIRHPIDISILLTHWSFFRH